MMPVRFPSRLRRVCPLLLATLLFAVAPAVCLAQLLDDTPSTTPTEYDDAVVGRFQVGAEITASRGNVTGIVAMVAVPLPCDEQTVKIVNENFSTNVGKVAYRNLRGGGARQMLISIPQMARGEKATAVVTFEVATRPKLPPEDADAEKLKLPKKLPSNIRSYRSPSPFIESRHGSIRSLSADILKRASAETSDWRRIEMLYDHVLDNIEYLEGPDTSAVTTLREKIADCHGRSALFVGLCRAAGYPARIVWVNNHCYAEFYLEDEAGDGAWYPIESAGSRAFGEMPLARVILQKGDNFRIPERKREKLRYATDYAIARSGKPRVEFIREQL